MAARLKSLPRSSRPTTETPSPRPTRLPHHSRLSSSTPTHSIVYTRGQRRNWWDPHSYASVSALVRSRRAHSPTAEYTSKRRRNRGAAGRRSADRRKPLPNVPVRRTGLQATSRHRLVRLHVRHRLFHPKRRRSRGRRQIRCRTRQRLRSMTRDRGLSSILSVSAQSLDQINSPSTRARSASLLHTCSHPHLHCNDTLQASGLPNAPLDAALGSSYAKTQARPACDPP